LKLKEFNPKDTPPSAFISDSSLKTGRLAQSPGSFDRASQILIIEAKIAHFRVLAVPFSS
jgi:hypothetical protein